MIRTPEYIFFYGGCFSQWFPSVFEIYGMKFVTAEQFMMYCKAIVFSDMKAASQILKTSNPEKQKRIGRLVKNFNDEIWDQHKLQVVYMGNYAKFTQNADLNNELKNTGYRLLVEASPTDKIWGIGLGLNNKLIYDRNNWRGQNYLGKIITKVRNDIFKTKKQYSFKICSDT